MIESLASLAGTEIRADVAIVGAGVAGLVIANRLRERGRTVVVLESGGRRQEGDSHPLNEVELLGMRYHGATRGRARCLGGTSTRWGGAMLPFFPEDLLAREYLATPAWPVAFDELRPGIRYLESLFALDGGSYEEDFATAPGFPRGDADFVSRFAKWPRFAARNLAQLLAARLGRDRGLRTILDATVTGLRFDPGTGRIGELVASAPGGAALRVAAGTFVLCAGAIENTRLLLIAHRADGRIVPAGERVLGRYFHDHLSAAAARFPKSSSPFLNRLAGFRFAGATMRSHRFELRPEAQARHRVPALWAHVAFGTTEPTAFDLLRTLLRGVQKGEAPGPASLLRLAGHAPFLARMAWWRVARRLLLWPPAAEATLHLVLEQAPVPANRITLATRRDAFGLPLAAIDWRVTDADRAAFAAGRRLFAAFWERSGLARNAPPEWLAEPTGDDAGAAPYGDVFHPGGTTRMGADPATAVLDGQLRVHGVANLYAPSTAAFPRGAGANPTMMLMLFGHRLAEHLADRG